MNNVKVLQPKINLENTTAQQCSCSCEIFLQAYRFRKISMLLSPTGKEEFIEQTLRVCAGCGAPLDFKMLQNQPNTSQPSSASSSESPPKQ